MKDKLTEALGQVSDAFIAQAAGYRRRRRKLVPMAVAAVLALALLFNLPHIPMAVSARAVAQASASRSEPRPDRDDYESFQEFSAVRDAWNTARDARDAAADAAVEALRPFFQATTAAYVGSSQENKVFSPINGYIALALLAELTGGESRAQILAALNTPDLTVLRSQVEAVWEDIYRDDGYEIAELANSLWLHEAISYQQEAMDNAAYYHYADIFQTDLASSRASRDLSAWLNNHTGGLLKQQADTASFPPQAVLTLASTVYLQSKWSEPFRESKNTRDIFHAPGGDREVTFMNKQNLQTNYYWGESFGAVNLWLQNGCKMWLILPDQGKTPADVLATGEYLEILTPEGSREGENCKYMKVNLSLPKFDILSSGNVAELFESLGITDVFDGEKADFTALTADTPVFLTGVNQAARVIVDEEGVKAASYLEMPGAGAAMPPEEIIDFILDRPFVFVIADEGGIPLFTGAVNEP